MTNYKLMVIPGDGIGQEITNSALKLLQATGFHFETSEYIAGDIALEKTGTPLPRETLEAAKKFNLILKGPVGESAKHVVLPLRQELNLYANLRPAKRLPGINTRLYEDERVDLLIVRENTEGLYSEIETMKKEFAFSVKLASSEPTKRIMKVGCELARTRRKKVTVIHKANVLQSDIFFRDICTEVGTNYPDLDIQHMYVDNCAYQLVRDPGQFDILVTPNSFGDILSDEASWVQGGLGTSPGANINEDKGMFEPVHGAAFDVVGKKIANPIAMMLCISMMLEWIGRKYADKNASDIAIKIEKAIDLSLTDGKKTPDLGGNLTTDEFTNQTISNYLSQES